ncbi:hypothetical protein FALCPG4_012603 [Fusarium falciforme]
MSNSKLFEPLQIGHASLSHRIVMAPMTRFRTDKDHAPLPIVKEYYAQRARTPGTLLIAEAAAPCLLHAGYAHFPGIWDASQTSKWKDVTEAVHARGSYIFLQLCAAGRTADSGFPKLAPSPIALNVSDSAIPIHGTNPLPNEMSEDDIQACIESFATAAQNAIAAGFDGVELHGANGYLIDQFIQESCNQRTDSWGGSVENRSRFSVEIARAVVQAVGNDRVGFRISPWSTYLSVKHSDQITQFSHLVRELKQLDLAYLHVVESCVDNWYDVDRNTSISFIVDIWDNQSPILLAGGYDAESARRTVDHQYNTYDVAIAFGRSFLSTPNWVDQVKAGLPPNALREETFYTPIIADGYTDYPDAA